ncbi:MAG: hypothetical protein LBD48_06160 [Treponema sp.]|jgi:hypothetical protein|nr:hypothetical protein [Treponema sp.]
MKADMRIVIVIAAFVVIAALGIAAYTTLEIYPRSYHVQPSAETAANKYLALERWLKQTGHPVRVSSSENLSQIVSAKERTVLVEESSCGWEDSAAVLLPWIQGGGSAVIILDKMSNHGDIDELLSQFGIGLYKPDEPEDDEAPDGDYDGEYEKHPLSKTGPDDTAGEHDINDTDFDETCGFVLAEPLIEGISSIAVIKDRSGIIRLAKASLGRGSVTFTGTPYFMKNQYLKKDANARLAWNLTAAQTTAENPNVLFIRDRHSGKGMFGRIAERGNSIPLIVSVLALIITGFWMVIPSFGIVPGEKQPWSQPITERFLAEIRFLKKYHALDYYVHVYVREITLKSGGLFDDNIKNEIAEIEQAVQSGGTGRTAVHFYQYRDIIKSLQRLETLSERLQWNK